MTIFQELLNNTAKYSLYLEYNINQNIINKKLLEKFINQKISTETFENFIDWNNLITELNEEEFSKNLRILKLLILSKIIIEDLNEIITLYDVINNISLFADFVINKSVEFAYKYNQNKYGTPIGSISNEKQYLSIVAMGKLGGFELNVASDIDLIFIYQEQGTTDSSKPIDNQEFFTKVGEKTINLIDNITSYGNVFKVDMRLRPNGDSGPLVISELAFENYLITQARNWERMAWIKARVVTNFPNNIIDIVRPFVFRKYLDFNIYDSLRETHQKIAQQAQKKDYQNNIKLGSGGIREIEFIVHIFQLIRGGQLTQLQQKSTIKALSIIKELKLIDIDTYNILLDSYCFLRNIEHRLQYWQNEQTHQLPKDEIQQELLAKSLKFNNYNDFIKHLNGIRSKINGIFNDLLLEKQQQNHDKKFKEFITICDDNESIAKRKELLKKYNVNNQGQIISRIDLLKSSYKYQQLNNTDKHRIDNIIPIALKISIETTNVSTCFIRLLDFFETITRKSSYLAFLYEKPIALKKAADIISKSTSIFDYLQKYPSLLDELINPSLLENKIDWNAFTKELKNKLAIYKEDTENQMNIIRTMQHLAVFKLMLQDLDGLWSVEHLSDELSMLADIIIQVSCEQVWQNYIKQKNITNFPLNFAIIGYGKLGSKELAYNSDLDLIYLYDDSNIDNNIIYTRFANRLTSFISSATSVGNLYNIDLRLRINGDSGFIVNSINMFEEYQYKNAWTWEHQALTKARVIYGNKNIQDKFNQIKTNILRKKRNLSEFKQEILIMRKKISDNKKVKPYDIKYSNGGIIDVEFIVQYIILAYSYNFPNLIDNLGNINLLKIATENNIIDKELSEKTQEAYRFYRKILHKKAIIDDFNYLKQEQQIKEYFLVVQKLWNKVFYK